VKDVDMPGVGQRFGVVGSVANENEPGAWIVEHVATRPEYRRRGLVDALLGDIFERGRSLGFSRSQIGVYIGNDAARAAYIKSGFLFSDEKRSAACEAAMGFPGIERLLREL
jgi:ribosomal protein S18 acetylase RimI-like enzyme